MLKGCRSPCMLYKWVKSAVLNSRHVSDARCQEGEPAVQQPRPDVPAAASGAAAPAGPASCARLTGSGLLPRVAPTPPPSQQPPAVLLPVIMHLCVDKCMHSVIHSLLHSLIHSSTHPPLIRPSTPCPSIHSFMHLVNHSFMHRSTCMQCHDQCETSHLHVVSSY